MYLYEWLFYRNMENRSNLPNGGFSICWQPWSCCHKREWLALWLAAQPLPAPDLSGSSCLLMTPRLLCRWRVWSYLSAPFSTCSPTCCCLSVCSLLFLTMSIVRTSLKLFLFGAVTVLVVLLLRHWMATKQYVFNKEDVARLAKQYAGEFDNVELYVKTKLQFTQMQSKVKHACV